MAPIIVRRRNRKGNVRSRTTPFSTARTVLFGSALVFSAVAVATGFAGRMPFHLLGQNVYQTVWLVFLIWAIVSFVYFAISNIARCVNRKSKVNAVIVDMAALIVLLLWGVGVASWQASARLPRDVSNAQRHTDISQPSQFKVAAQAFAWILIANIACSLLVVMWGTGRKLGTVVDGKVTMSLYELDETPPRPPHKLVIRTIPPTMPKEYLASPHIHPQYMVPIPVPAHAHPGYAFAPPPPPIPDPPPTPRPCPAPPYRVSPPRPDHPRQMVQAPGALSPLHILNRCHYTPTSRQPRPSTPSTLTSLYPPTSPPSTPPLSYSRSHSPTPSYYYPLTNSSSGCHDTHYPLTNSSNGCPETPSASVKSIKSIKSGKGYYPKAGYAEPDSPCTSVEVEYNNFPPPNFNVRHARYFP